jgi:hypothetical protein
LPYLDCQRSEPCRITPIPVEKWPKINFEDGVDSKAYAIPDPTSPEDGFICADRELWNDHTPQGKIWTYCHELAHCEGARCEPCADFRAGEIIEQSGWSGIHPEDEDGQSFLESIAETLQYRDPATAQRAFASGYLGLGLDTTDLETQDATFYVNAQPYSGKIVQIRSGIWVNDAHLDDWDGLFTMAAAAGINWTVNSSFRSMDQQITEWNKRHLQTWDQNPSANAAVDDVAVSNLGPAAVPGFSEHQQGNAVDLSFDSDDSRDQFAAMAEGFNIYRDAPSERWHFAWVDPGSYPNGRRKYPLGGIPNTPGNIAAGARVAKDKITQDSLGSEANPTQSYVTSSPSLLFPIALVVIIGASLGWFRGN